MEEDAHQAYIAQSPLDLAILLLIRLSFILDRGDGGLVSADLAKKWDCDHFVEDEHCWNSCILDLNGQCERSEILCYEQKSIEVLHWS